MKDIKIHPKALKELTELPHVYKKKVKSALRLLAEKKDQNLDTLKIRGKKGKEDLIRLRIGDYRIIYKIERNTIFIIRIAHRSQVYRGL